MTKKHFGVLHFVVAGDIFATRFYDWCPLQFRYFMAPHFLHVFAYDVPVCRTRFTTLTDAFFRFFKDYIASGALVSQTKCLKFNATEIDED